jgi:hypothetical protein
MIYYDLKNSLTVEHYFEKHYSGLAIKQLPKNLFTTDTMNCFILYNFFGRKLQKKIGEKLPNCFRDIIGDEIRIFASLPESKNIGCFFKFHLKVGVEESIVNAPLVSLDSKNTNNAKVRLDLNS